MAQKAEGDVKQGGDSAQSTASETVKVETTTESLETQKQQLEQEIEQVKAEATTTTETVEDSSAEDVKPEKTHEDKVPYERFKEVNDRVKALEAHLAEVTEQLKTQAQASKPKTIEDFSVEDLRKVRDYHREQGEHQKADYYTELIAERKASQRTAEQVAQSKEVQQFNSVRVATWTEVVTDYPDLKNTESEHYKLTEQIVESDPRFNKTAEGHAVAARLAAEKLLKVQIQKLQQEKQSLNQRVGTSAKTNALETGKRAPASSGTSLEKLRDAAENSVNAHSREWRTYFAALEAAKKAK